VAILSTNYRLIIIIKWYRLNCGSNVCYEWVHITTSLYSSVMFWTLVSHKQYEEFRWNLQCLCKM